MAFNDTTDQTYRVSSMTRDRLSQMTLMTGLTNRDWQREAEQQPYPRFIDIHTFGSQTNWDSTASTADVAYDADMTWADAVEDDSSVQRLNIDRAAQGSIFMGWRDIMQLPLNLQMQETARLAWQMQKQLDTQCIADLIGTGAAGSKGIDTTANDATDGITLAGTTTNFINAQGVPQGTGMAKQLHDWVRDFSNYADDTGFGFDSNTPIFKWMLMPGRLISVLEDYIVDEKTKGGSFLADSILGDNSLGLLGRGAMRRSKGRLYGVELLSATDLLPVSTIGGVQYWNIVASTSRAFVLVTQGVLMQNLTAEQNQIGTGDPTDKGQFARPGGLLRSILPYGDLLLQREQARLYRMRRA